MSACFTLRKINQVVIHEETQSYRLRPQIHPLIVSPFGTAKSSITKKLNDDHAGKIYEIDDFTKASICGSIRQDGEYVPSVLENVGGKVMIIDEWNLVDPYGQNALISLLENQKMRRTLGFKVNKKYVYKGKDRKFITYKIHKNIIEGSFYFSCIAYAMEYPIYDNNQKIKALLSRFSPIFIEPTKQMIRALTKGDFAIKLNDVSQNVEFVEIPKDIHTEFHEKYYKSSVSVGNSLLSSTYL